MPDWMRAILAWLLTPHVAVAPLVLFLLYVAAVAATEWCLDVYDLHHRHNPPEEQEIP